MAITSRQLLEMLEEMGIEAQTRTHPPLHTVADSQALRGDIPGGHTKNLFLKDRTDNFFLLTVGEEAEIDLKQIHHTIGAAGRVSFGKPDRLQELLGIEPGAVSAFGIVNDTGGKVSIFFDAALMENEIINVHPLVNTATTSIRREDLLRFVRSSGHEPNILKLTG